MDCEVVKVQPLLEGESFNLFLKHVGHNVLQIPNLEETLKQIVQQCAGLPLAIVIIARSMKGVDDDREWKNVLNELCERVKSVKGMDIEIFECLKLSYDRLRDLKIQNCFLYCSLYPEDYPIKRKELMEKWIDGLVDEFGTREAMHCRGHSILKKLECNCLLERANNEEEVKMHDVLRDMALFIIKSAGHHFMVKAGLQLKKLPSELEWVENLEKVSMMDNKISAIPVHLSPKCHNLSTLLLQENYTLERISESFFEHMLGLKVLDLSDTGILHLPNSVSNLENLVALVLRNCDKLRYVCSLAKLRALRKLDLFNTDIKEVPHGIETLATLTYLALYSDDLMEIPMGILSNFSHLQYLATMLLNIEGEEVAKLRELEIVSGSFSELQDFQKYAKSVDHWPNHYRLAVGSTRPDYIDYDDWFPCFENPELYEELCFINCQIGGEGLLVLPNNLSTLRIEDCHEFKSLSNLCSLHEVNELKICSICQCEGMECVIDWSLSSCNSLSKIEKLSLGDLCNLNELVRVEEAAVVSTSHARRMPAMFSSLKTLFLWCCPGMKKLCSLQLLQGLQNIEHIEVVNCKEMEKIVASEENHQGEAGGATAGITTVILPKLRELSLKYLPELKTICSGGVMVSANCLKHLSIIDCSMLKKIPLTLPVLDNGQPIPPPSLQQITIDPREWWETVEWDDTNAKDVLSPFVCFQ